MVDSEETLDFLEQRVSMLESLVFGQAEKDADYPKNLQQKKQIIDSLLEIQKKIKSSLSGKKKAAQLYEKLPQLRRCLDHRYTDDMALSSDAREETIIAASDFLKSQAGLFQQLEENRNHVNSEHMSVVPKLSGKLHTLSQVQIEQQDGLAQLSEDTRHALEAYNCLVTLLSKQFILWDEQVTKLELQAQVKWI